MILNIFTDGGSKGNPGPAAIGVVFYIDKEVVFTYREDIGVATNNVAEYSALIGAMLKFKELRHKFSDINKINFYSDSQLLVNQLKGLYKIKNQVIAGLVSQVRALEKELGIPISYHAIPREENVMADAMVNNRHSQILQR